MKLVKITMELIIDEDSPADNWIYSTISDQLEVGEGIIDWQYEVLNKNVNAIYDEVE